MSIYKKYYPKRPVKSFLDLEVYQKLQAVAVVVCKRVESEKIRSLLLNLPLLLAEAHSLRFSAPETAIDKLEEVMLGCNQAVVYLEQYRDLAIPLPKLRSVIGATGDKSQKGQGAEGRAAGRSGNSGSGAVNSGTAEFYEEQVKNLLTTRRRVLHLQFSWKKFMEQKQKEEK